MSKITTCKTDMAHHPINTPMQLRKAAGVLHAYINNQFMAGVMSGDNAERLSLGVTKLLPAIMWPDCDCPGCEAVDGKY